MSKGIKGITIELDGDTTGLTKALKKVDTETKSVQNELKQVDRLLKFDPSNTELLAQKQKLLGNAVDNTSKRLDALKQAQGEVEKQFKNGDIGEEAFRKFQREIVATEGKLKSFESQAKSVDARIEPKADTSGIDKMKSALKELGPAAKDAAKEISSQLGTAGAAGAAAVGALVVGTSELNTDLARLKTNASMAGADLGIVEDAFTKVVAVTSEADSAVETVSNLLASGFKDSQLTTMIEGINGAAIKFSDTLKTEGIADGIQETFATGKSIGMFAELLERSGVNLEEFDAKLAAAKKTGTEADLIMQTMADLGLAKVNDQYKELNPQVVANAEAQANLQKAMADLGLVLTPLVVMITELVTKFVEWAASNPELMTTLAVIAGSVAALSGAFALILPIVSNLVTLFPILKLGIAALTGPIGLAIAGAVALGAGLIALWTTSETFRNGVTQVFELLKNSVSTALSTIAEFAKQKFSEIKVFWDENGAQILQAVQNFANMMVNIFNFFLPALQFVVEYVWSAIKNVISGALDSIMGVTKIFSGLFTGDFSKMWEGVKQLFSGAVKLILGIMSLTFVGGIRSAITNLAKTVINAIRNKWTSVVSLFKNGGTGAINAVKNMASNVWNFVKNLATNFVNTISTMRTNVVNKFNELKTSIVNKVKSIDLVQIGKDIVKGLISGIGNMFGNVKAKISELANMIPDWAKKVLDIHSPSRVMKAIGEFIGQGLAVGISDSKSVVKQSMEDLGYTLIDVADHFKDEQEKIQKESSKAVAKAVDDGVEKIKKVESKAQSDINKIVSAAQKKKRDLTKAEKARIATIEQNAASEIIKINKNRDEKVATLRQKAVTDKIKSEEAANKEYLATVQQYIDDKKSLEQMSLVEEAAIWEKSTQLFDEGTTERIKAQQNYQKAYETLSKEIVSINENYQSKMKSIDDQLIKDIETQNERYDSAFESRKNTLFSFAGTFDEFKTEMDVTGEELLANLQGQVDGFKTWQDQFAQISGRGINADLLKELQDLGPKALPQLMALNSLTDEQLTQYSDTYAEKSRLAREQAEAELIGMKEDTEKQITALREVADEQLTKLQEEWNSQIVAITKGTSSELSSLQRIGKDAGQGLLNGLSSMQGPLIAKAREIANAISSTIQSALDIHSPSRVMKGFGINIGQGLIAGMDNMIKRVAQSSARLSEAVIGAQGLLNINASRLSSGMPSTTSSVDNSRTFAPVVHISGGGNNINAMDRTLRRLALKYN